MRGEGGLLPVDGLGREFVGWGGFDGVDPTWLFEGQESVLAFFRGRL